jgi:hypothetical protein
MADTDAVAGQSEIRGAMTVVRCYLAVVGLAAMLGALVSLTLPLHLDAADRHGRPLPCGSALRFDHDTVAAEDQLNQQLHEQNDRLQISDYAGECAAWVKLKRRAALLVGTAGAAVIASTELLMREVRRRQLRDVIEVPSPFVPSSQY